MTGEEIRSSRLAAGITAQVLRCKAKMRAGRLSEIETGRYNGTHDETKALADALCSLIQAKEKINSVALEVGWPWKVL